MLTMLPKMCAAALGEQLGLCVCVKRETGVYFRMRKMEMMGQENMIRDEMGPVFTPMAQSLVQPLSLPYLHYSAVTRKHVEYVEAGSAIHTRIVRTSAIVELHRIPKKKKGERRPRMHHARSKCFAQCAVRPRTPSHGAVPSQS